jgi:uncharacterized protein (DUF1800 family)
MFRAFVIAAALALVVAGLPAAPAIPNDERAIVHALNRLAYGPRPGDVERVKATGLAAWIDRQLAPSSIDNAPVESRLTRLETLGLDSATIAREYTGPAMEERRRRQQQNQDPSPPPRLTMLAPGLGADPSQMLMNDLQRMDRQVIAELEEAKILRAVYSERQLEEILVDFWFNHFNVFAGKGAVRNYITAYERDAIRPHVLGNFRQLLDAVAKSPAMLFYLDNWMSVDPQGSRGSRGSRGSQDSAPQRMRGLNENYARELMELHTLGVDGGYTQQDIVAVARAFTGWTMRPREGTGFMFVPFMHDSGEKKVLGHTIKAGGGVEDGLKVLDILATHPSTATFIARKLVERFVSETPSPALVDRVSARFAATGGDLREVVRTVITSPEFFAPEAYRAKVKTPFEFVASALRATGAEVRNALPLSRQLRNMGMPLYFCQPPTGYEEAAATWVSSGALVSRMNFALELGRNRGRAVSIPLGPGTTAGDWRARLAKDALADDVSEATRATLAKATSVEQVVALAIGSPEFQRQ